MDPSNSNNKDAQAAFQEFMMRGRGEKKKKSGVDTSSSSSSLTRNHPPALTPSNDINSHQKTSHRTSNSQKGYPPVLRACQGSLQDWMDSNLQLAQVMASIVNLRDRIAWESNELRGLQEMIFGGDEEQDITLKPWNGCGFRRHTHHPNTFLTSEDVQNALDHDILQHERMLSSLRSLIASLAQTLDTLGRRMDEWMIQTSFLADSSRTQQEYQLLDDLQHVYDMLASNLFQKQVAVQQVLDSCNDGLVGHESKHAVLVGSPRDVAKQAVKLWSSASTNQIDILVGRLLNVHAR